MSHEPGHGFHGPRCWAVSATAGLAVGLFVAWIAPGQYDHGHPLVPLWLVAPFVLLLLSIATMPFVSARIWHAHFPDFAFGLGGIVLGYYLLAYRSSTGHSLGLPSGVYDMLHAGLEYYAFIALVGGLYVVSGGVQIDMRARGTAAANTLLLGAGAVLANIVGTTGASMLLVRPYMRMNKMNGGRLHAFHIVMFIVIVSNCGGCLTPIGDPPLYLGFLSGIPFFWTLQHLWMDWLLVNACLLVAFYAIDRWYVGTGAEHAAPSDPAAATSALRIRGTTGITCLALMLLGVFIDPVQQSLGVPRYVPIGPTFQIIVALVAWRLTPAEIHRANEFSFFPVREVGLLFLGIFATMVPALGYLSMHGGQFGLSSATAFFFFTGGLSALLDNAPTYMTFLQVAVANPWVNPASQEGATLTVANVRAMLATDTGTHAVHAISTGAVFFGALTYIGNGPNFMVKAIAEEAGVRMPGFVGYLSIAAIILLPVLVLNWAIMIL